MNRIPILGALLAGFVVLMCTTFIVTTPTLAAGAALVDDLGLPPMATPLYADPTPYSMEQRLLEDGYTMAQLTWCDTLYPGEEDGGGDSKPVPDPTPTPEPSPDPAPSGGDSFCTLHYRL